MRRVLTGKTLKAYLLLVFVILVGLILSSCSEATPTEYRIGYVIGGGTEDSRAIKKIVMPGKDVSKETDDEVQWVYGNARNYRVANNPAADRTGVWLGKTKPSDDGQTPGYEIQAEGIAYFAINRPAKTVDECSPDSDNSACLALFAFFSYCEKYDCITGESNEEDDPENQNRSSDAGWMNMLHEGLGNALSHAFTQVIAEYDINIVNEPQRWPEIGKKMSELVRTEMRSVIGISKGLDVFCSATVISTGKCEPIDIRLEAVASPQAAEILNTRRDQEIKTENALAEIDNKRRIQEANQSLEASRAAAEAALYGQPGYAEQRRWQLLIEAIKACAGNTQCIIQLDPNGNSNSGVQLQVPTK